MSKAFVLTGNALQIPLASDSIDVVVTSPPYWSLRRYEGVQDKIWGGDANCKHEWVDYKFAHGAAVQKGKHRWTHSGETIADNPDLYATGHAGEERAETSYFCFKCNAWLGSLGLEPSAGLFVEHLVMVFREVRRVLSPTGTCWLNIGDTYLGSGGPGNQYEMFESADGKYKDFKKFINANRYLSEGYKNLDQANVPFRLYEALRKDGWYARCTVIWAKNNTMPQSVRGWQWRRHRIKIRNKGRGKEPKRVGTGAMPQQDHADHIHFRADAHWEDCPGCKVCEKHDGWYLSKGAWRPTTAHEYIFQLTKTDSYYSDQLEVMEPISRSSFERYLRGVDEDGKWKDGAPGQGNHHQLNQKRENVRAEEKDVWDYDELVLRGEMEGKNKRSVWQISTKGYPGDHFATFPPELVETCIRASASKGGKCPECGAPRVRKVERRMMGSRLLHWHTLGWLPSCDHDHEPVPMVVYDPFGGAGTTPLVARILGHTGISTDVSLVYTRQAYERLALDTKKIWTEQRDDTSEDTGGILSLLGETLKAPAPNQLSFGVLPDVQNDGQETRGTVEK